MSEATLQTREAPFITRLFTFRETRAAMAWSIGLYALAAIASGLGAPLFVQAIACAALVFFALNALWSVRESSIAVIGLALVLFWVLLATAAPLLPLRDPTAVSPAFKGLSEVLQIKTLLTYAPDMKLTEAQSALLEKPTWFGYSYEGETYTLGIDHKGRDILSRLIWGAQRVLVWASLATATAYIVGMLFGVMAGYLGGWVDEVISFVANIMLSFPVMVLYIIIITQLGASGVNVIIAVTFASAPGIMRIVRGLVLDLKTRDYIAAAQTRGESAWYIMLFELLPNARGPLIVDACLRLGYTTIAIATLGFLGLGLPPPEPDWGSMLAEARAKGATFHHMIIIPAAALSSLILGFNLMADGLREISLRD
ncbi:MAG: ABC transporter permease [Neomegalonema sp.]|nr:ABC transporter permease [Neomegalonema sp.]